MTGMPRFLCDAMLGTLARWLRLLGYDAELVGPDARDAEVAARAAAEGRVLLTRDRELAAAGPRTVLVRAERLEDQLAEVIGRLGLDPRPEARGTRCAACNGEVTPVERETVAGLVPPYVYGSAGSFRRCAGCGRVYWRGSHVPRIERRLERVLRAARAMEGAGAAG